MFKVLNEKTKEVFTVYSVRTYDHRYSTEFLLYVNDKWTWMESKHFVPARPNVETFEFDKVERRV